MISPVEIMHFVDPNELGGKNNPISNEQELLKGIENKRNCCMYTKGTLLLPQCIFNELETKNIELFGEDALKFAKAMETSVLEGNIDFDVVPEEMLKDIVKDIKPILKFQVNNKNNNLKKCDIMFDELYKNNLFELHKGYITERRKSIK